MPVERVQKILARAGVASRRAAERLIADRRVRVNGRIIEELGSKADTIRDRVEVDGKRIVAEQPVYYLLHKPREVVTTLADPEQRASVADLMKGVYERVFPIGRLDYHTSGALLMTNDGDMSQALLHPRKRVPKVYVAKLKGKVALGNIQRLREGVVLDDGEKTAKAEVFIVNEERGNTWLQLTIIEGRNRQVHRMAEAIGHRVQRLFRMSFVGIDVDGMRPGEFRVLSDSEVSKLKRDYLNPSQREKSELAREARRERMQPSLSDTHSAAPRNPRRATGLRPEPEAPAPRQERAAAPTRGARSAPAQRPDRAAPQPTRFARNAPPARPDRAAPQPTRGARNAPPARPDRAASQPTRFSRNAPPTPPDRDAPPARFGRNTRPERTAPAPRKQRGTPPARFARNTSTPRPAPARKPTRPRKPTRSKTS